MPRSVVMEGELVCLDNKGRSQFNDLLFRRGEPCFVAFDLLQTNGKDLRGERLLDRKHELRRIISGASSIIYADHIEGSGTALFQKLASWTWRALSQKMAEPLTILSRLRGSKFGIANYSQMFGREELFERDRSREPVPGSAHVLFSSGSQWLDP
jgi:hypothetical protein